MPVRTPTFCAEGVHASTGARADVAPLLGALHLRLIDFGSALDARSMESMYGVDGPSAAEQTPEYAPPEAVFASRWPGPREVR